MVNLSKDLDDNQLMMNYQNGDTMAFDMLYLRHQDKVYSYLSKRVHQRDDIDDLYQKVFIKLHKSKHLYYSKYEFLPWLYTITKSIFLDYVKVRKKEFTEFDEQLHSPNEEERIEIDLSSEKSLTQNEKTVIESRFTEDKDFKEIAELVSTSESNVRKILSRGLKKLKSKYRSENEF